MAMQREVTYSVEHFYPKHPGHPMAALTAQARGYFRDDSIQNSHLVIAGDNEGTIELLVQGKTEFSMDAHPAMLIEANARGKDLYIIGSYRNGLPFSVAAPPGTVKDAADLKGRRFVTNRRMGAGERTMRFIFEKLGMDPDRDMEVVLIDNEGMREKVAAIKEGRGDFLFYHQGGPQGRIVKELIRQGELVEVVDLSKLVPEYVVRSMAASGRMVREHPEIVKGFIKGVMRAHRFIKHEDPMGADCIEILKQALNVDTLEGSGVENGIPKSWPVEPREVIASVAGVQVHVDELKAKGKIGPKFSAADVVRNEPAYRALEELRS